MIVTNDGNVYMLRDGTLRHKCPIMTKVDILNTWKLCPWCGKGLVRDIKAVTELTPTGKVQWVEGTEADI